MIAAAEHGRLGGLPPEKIRLGEVWCSRCTPRELVSIVDHLLRDRTAGPRTVTFLNAHVFCLAHADEDLKHQLRNAGIVAVDGVSISLASWLLHGLCLPRCMMTRAFDTYVLRESATQTRAILVGAGSEESEAAAAEINRLSPHLRVVAAFSGYLSIEEYRAALSDLGDIDLVLLGMGSPRSEILMARVGEWRPAAVLWHIGAGTIKCYAGTKRRAPDLLHAFGLEWAHRMVFEPHTRKRYLIGIPQFAWCLARLRMGRKPIRSTPLQRNLGGEGAPRGPVPARRGSSRSSSS